VLLGFLQTDTQTEVRGERSPSSKPRSNNNSARNPTPKPSSSRPGQGPAESTHSVCEKTLAERLGRVRTKEEVALVLENVPMNDTRVNSMLWKLGKSRKITACEALYAWAKESPIVRLNHFHYTSLISALAGTLRCGSTLPLFHPAASIPAANVHCKVICPGETAIALALLSEPPRRDESNFHPPNHTTQHPRCTSQATRTTKSDCIKCASHVVSNDRNLTGGAGRLVARCFSRRWERALQVFEESKAAGIKPSVFVYSTLMSACSKGGQWRTALLLLERMKADGVKPNIVTYSSLIFALGKGGQVSASTRVSPLFGGHRSRTRLLGELNLGSSLPAGGETGVECLQHRTGLSLCVAPRNSLCARDIEGFWGPRAFRGGCS
jgi:pentatricopeptide repeat protein